MSKKHEHHRQHGGGSGGSNQSVSSAVEHDLYELGSNAENAQSVGRFAAPDQSLLQQAGYSGAAMDLPYQAQLEAKFGMNLADIQAEHGNADAMQHLGADAFATGNLVAFSSSSPSFEQVQHEVVHVVQQGKGQGRGISQPDSGSELYAKLGIMMGTGTDASLHRDEVRSLFPDGTMLRRGSRGELVQKLQVALNVHGYNLETDGIFGKGTEAATRDYQAQNGLETDGVAGRQTLSVLAPNVTNAVGTAALVEDALGQTEEELEQPVILPGTEYTVNASDLTSGPAVAWRDIARKHGMSEENLIPFNQHILSVATEQDAAHTRYSEVPELAEGVQIYIPSADDLAFAECTKRGGSVEEAERLYAELYHSSNLGILRVARTRGAGELGQSYGNKGLGKDIAGVFLSPNASLAGASSRRSREVNGQTEYEINWNATKDGFWKCSLFLHDVVFQAGFKPHQTSNDHYQLAGRLHQSQMVEEVPVEKAGPGCLWQRFGGTGADESHNAILTSFVDVETVDEETDRWHFAILGAERESAGESHRQKEMLKGKNETVDGKIIRFFKPRHQR